MKPLISTADDAARLRAEAESWLGTPYVPEGAVKGTGCSCSALPYAILKGLGHGAPTIPRRQTLKKDELLPAMVAWLVAHPEYYVRVEPTEISPGDVLVIKAGIGHMLLCYEANGLIHSWQGRGVHRIDLQDSSITDRIVGVWRPVTSHE